MNRMTWSICLGLLAVGSFGCVSTPKQSAATSTPPKANAAKPATSSTSGGMSSMSSKPQESMMMGSMASSPAKRLTAEEITEANLNQQMRAFQDELTRDMRAYDRVEQGQASLTRPGSR
ncbi:hypothetical protein [Tuwongella immobilis]|uniref:Uncharacterized protein n=1 Tax=Tuwongella immobilis TaxID=692036 RepID=A0A6C2YW75_9BACT|nr:hypothetical protein [Tuwongella immobilis]VIP05413.1 unnamed protein product [Tuwongella immobilis]VTS08182.1 unnamed protein product [Tuwongella immobilis]